MNKVYLDTHAAIWLADGVLDKFSIKSKTLMSSNPLFISPYVLYEIELLREINRIKISAKDVYKILQDEVSLQICTSSFHSVIEASLDIKWTRDPGDRIITAQAMLNKSQLVTKDDEILKNYINAVW